MTEKRTITIRQEASNYWLYSRSYYKNKVSKKVVAENIKRFTNIVELSDFFKPKFEELLSVTRENKNAKNNSAEIRSIRRYQ